VKRSLALVALASLGLLEACGGAAPPPPAVAPLPPPAPAPPPPPPPAPSAPTNPGLSILLRPVHDPSPHVHVEIDVSIPASVDLKVAGGPLQAWRIRRTGVDRVSNVAAHDDTGEIKVDVAAAAPGVELTLGRPLTGAVHLSYDVAANGDAPDDPLGQLVLDDRFRGAGEGLLALPSALDDLSVPTILKIDGEALRAPNAASSFGFGASHHMTIRPRVLRYGSFLAGSMGAAKFEDDASGRDEGAWLGYTSFDPRPAVAEMAVIRTGLSEQFKEHDNSLWTYLLMAQTRPVGSFSTTARAASVLLQLGPSEPWSAPLRLSVGQQLAHRWIGGELRLASPPPHDAEAWWFNDGVARYVAMHVLSRLGLFTANDTKDEIAGQLAVLATTGFAKRTNAELAAEAESNDVARAVLVARGALFAAREAAVIRARSKGEKSLDAVLLALVEQARHDGGRPVQATAVVDALAKEDPDAAKSFDAFITRGAPLELPPSALGPCFHSGAGEYVAFDPGFDVVGTREAKEGRVVGLRPGGPAAKAGLREGDLVQTMTERDGDADVPVKIAVMRGGAKVNVTYLPKGAHGRGQTWARVRTVPDDHCGDMP